MKLTLNVGLARNDGRADNGILRTVAVLNQCGFMIDAANVQLSDTEHTLVAVVRVLRPETLPFDLYTVAARLAQDCIAAAQRDSNGNLLGGLHGPEFGKWGEFNPEFFLTLNSKEYA
jgi:hypothetical protein